jgi:light-regulated signal transduction histidine kinase (bacteriophytochrome)
LRQVFQNLIENALKYSKADISPVIQINFTELEKEYQFSIEDNGIGISEEYFQRIFIIFQRLHNKDEYSGTGMGLSITKKIVENLGGKIWLSSEIEKGTTFYFTIFKN